MKKLLTCTVLALTLAASACGDGKLTVEEAGTLFCQRATSIVGKLALYRDAGQLTPSQILVISRAVMVIDPYCSAETPGDPGAAVVSALEQLVLALQLQEGKGEGS